MFKNLMSIVGYISPLGITFTVGHWTTLCYISTLGRRYIIRLGSALGEERTVRFYDILGCNKIIGLKLAVRLKWICRG